jgi:molybdopterin synthase catalytic subunit
MRTITDFFELTFDVLDVGAIMRRVVPGECGATVVLDGYVRQWMSGKETLYLIYEAYEAMALLEMKRLALSAREQFEIAHISIIHRLGQLEIGETSIVIAVAAPHRKAAFAACEWLIKEIKQSVPIWKKEVYREGSAWAAGENLMVANEGL